MVMVRTSSRSSSFLKNPSVRHLMAFALRSSRSEVLTPSPQRGELERGVATVASQIGRYFECGAQLDPIIFMQSSSSLIHSLLLTPT
jgi:hypothetical protein